MPTIIPIQVELSTTNVYNVNNPNGTIINADGSLTNLITINLPPNVTTAEDRYIIGFNRFDFHYHENHHISNLGLQLTHQLINNGRAIDVTVTMQMNDHSGHSLERGCVNVVLVYYNANENIPDVNQPNTVELVSMTEFDVAYEDGQDHHLMNFYAYTDGSDINNNHYNRAYIEDDSNHTGVGTTRGMTLRVDNAFLHGNDRELFINHFNLGHYKSDGHILQLSIDGRQNANNANDANNNPVYAMSDGADFNAQYCECRMDTLGNANWMSRVQNNPANPANPARLSDLILPASHDAGMSICRNIFPCFLGAYHMKTQDYPIYEQLMCGCRYFDIRVDKQNDELVTYHRSGPLGSDGESIQEVFNQAEHFLTRFPSETIIIKISHIRGKSLNLANDTIRFLQNYNHNYAAQHGGNNLFYTSQNDVDLHNINLAALAGHILVVCKFDGIQQFEGIVYTTEGIFCYKDVDADANQNLNVNNVLRVSDKYSNTSNYDTMQADQTQKWNLFHNNQNNNDQYWFLLSWTLTQLLYSIKNGAATANRALAAVLLDRIGGQNPVKQPNLVYLDFINTDLCNTVINYNNLNNVPVVIKADFQEPH